MFLKYRGSQEHMNPPGPHSTPQADYTNAIKAPNKRAGILRQSGPSHRAPPAGSSTGAPGQSGHAAHPPRQLRYSPMEPEVLDFTGLPEY